MSWGSAHQAPAVEELRFPTMLPTCRGNKRRQRLAGPPPLQLSDWLKEDIFFTSTISLHHVTENNSSVTELKSPPLNVFPIKKQTSKYVHFFDAVCLVFSYFNPQ